MSEAEAKEQLNLILESFTVGGILNLLADIYREMADDANKITMPSDETNVPALSQL